MNFGLPDITINKMISVFSNHNEIDKVLIYGSRAKGNFRKGSDIDLTLVGKNLNAHLISEINEELDELNTPYLIDLSIYDTLKFSELEEHIQRVGKVFYVKSSNSL